MTAAEELDKQLGRPPLGHQRPEWQRPARKAVASHLQSIQGDASIRVAAVRLAREVVRLKSAPVQSFAPPKTVVTVERSTPDLGEIAKNMGESIARRRAGLVGDLTKVRVTGATVKTVSTVDPSRVRVS